MDKMTIYICIGFTVGGLFGYVLGRLTCGNFIW
jgi:hypothetical protein